MANILITGTSKGIGYEAALLLARRVTKSPLPCEIQALAMRPPQEPILRVFRSRLGMIGPRLLVDRRRHDSPYERLDGPFVFDETRREIVE